MYEAATAGNDISGPYTLTVLTQTLRHMAVDNIEVPVSCRDGVPMDIIIADTRNHAIGKGIERAALADGEINSRMIELLTRRRVYLLAIVEDNADRVAFQCNKRKAVTAVRRYYQIL